MLLKDRYDLQISTSSDVARQAYVEAVDAILSATGNVEMPWTDALMLIQTLL